MPAFEKDLGVHLLLQSCLQERLFFSFVSLSQDQAADWFSEGPSSSRDLPIWPI